MSVTPEMTEFAEKLAAQFPPWELDREWEAYDRLRLVNPELPEAAIHLEFARGRAQVSGQYFYGYGPAWDSAPRMSVSVARKITAIALEVKRRFLDDYLALFAESQEAAYRAALAKGQAQSFSEELAQVLGETAREIGEGWLVYTTYGSFRITPGSQAPHVTIERFWGLDAELALELAGLLGRWKEIHGSNRR